MRLCKSANRASCDSNEDASASLIDGWESGGGEDGGGSRSYRGSSRVVDKDVVRTNLYASNESAVSAEAADIPKE